MMRRKASGARQGRASMLAAASWATGRVLKWVVEWKVELEITKMQTIPSAQNFFYHTYKSFCATKQNTKKAQI
jgi:hypothetical protein